MTDVTLYKTGYDRNACDIGIVHVGFGAFHRAHQAVYIDDVMEQTGDLGWGIAAVNLRESESELFAQSQNTADGYLLKTTSTAGDQQWRLVRPHIAFRDWSKDVEGAESLLALPSVHVVTMTVTESGYALNDDGTLNIHDPVIAKEISGGPARSIYGYLTRALQMRVDRIDQPISLLCCDNIRSNGHMLEQNLLSYLDAMGHRDLRQWVENNVSFPCSMVDRITPRSTPQLIEEVAHHFPGQSLAPVHGEDFIQWVIEDKFAAPMPNLAKAGVQIVDDVDPYEETKIRILNGGHTGLAYMGALFGHRTFDQAILDPDLRAHFDRWETENVLPGLPDDLPINKKAYLAKITDRFANKAIADALERICMDGTSKMPIFVQPTLASCLEKGIVPSAGYDCVASWVVYARLFSEGRMPVPYRDSFWEDLKPMIEPGAEEKLASDTRLWNDIPTRFPDFVSDLSQAIRRMDSRFRSGS